MQCNGPDRTALQAPTQRVPKAREPRERIQESRVIVRQLVMTVASESEDEDERKEMCPQQQVPTGRPSSLPVHGASPVSERVSRTEEISNPRFEQGSREDAFAAVHRSVFTLECVQARQVPAAIRRHQRTHQTDKLNREFVRLAVSLKKPLESPNQRNNLVLLRRVIAIRVSGVEREERFFVDDAIGRLEGVEDRTQQRRIDSVVPQLFDVRRASILKEAGTVSDERATAPAASRVRERAWALLSETLNEELERIGVRVGGSAEARAEVSPREPRERQRHRKVKQLAAPTLVEIARDGLALEVHKGRGLYRVPDRISVRTEDRVAGGRQYPRVPRDESVPAHDLRAIDRYPGQERQHAHVASAVFARERRRNKYSIFESSSEGRPREITHLGGVQASCSEGEVAATSPVRARPAHVGRLHGDNARCLVVERNRETQTVTFTPAYAAFCQDWGVQPRACQPYRARTKGKTESGVKYVKRNAIADRRFESFEHLQAHLAEWQLAADQRVHGTTHEVPMVRFDREELAALRPLPARPLPTHGRRLQRRVSNDAFVDIDTVRYSVPHRLVRDRVEAPQSSVARAPHRSGVISFRWVPRMVTGQIA
jgi:hypothetical protein